MNLTSLVGSSFEHVWRNRASLHAPWGISQKTIFYDPWYRWPSLRATCVLWTVMWNRSSESSTPMLLLKMINFHSVVSKLAFSFWPKLSPGTLLSSTSTVIAHAKVSRRPGHPHQNHLPKTFLELTLKLINAPHIQDDTDNPSNPIILFTFFFLLLLYKNSMICSLVIYKPSLVMLCKVLRFYNIIPFANYTQILKNTNPHK